MRKDVIILLAVLIPTALLMLFISRNVSTRSSDNLFATTSPYPTISMPGQEDVENKTITPAASRNIEVLSPLTGDKVKSGFVVKGNARTFESTVNIRLSDSSGNVIMETFTTAKAPDVGQFGPFEELINFSTDDQMGQLEVFQYSAKDGSEIDKVTIPLQFSK